MPTVTDLATLVDEFAAAIPKLNLDKEYTTMLLRLQNQVETGEPIEWIVQECIDYLNRVVSG